MVLRVVGVVEVLEDEVDEVEVVVDVEEDESEEDDDDDEVDVEVDEDEELEVEVEVEVELELELELEDDVEEDDVLVVEDVLDTLVDEDDDELELELELEDKDVEVTLLDEEEDVVFAGGARANRLSLLLPPQYSEELPLQSILQLDGVANVAAGLRVLPHQHSLNRYVSLE
ncbi:MAG: hypothetical protein M1824_001433 [Vezdaea acicularis]|nr:MAG: hypothetical protein M1824_001433 [Vezdaea acicularis]